MTARQVKSDDEILDRDGSDPGDIANGDAQLGSEPPNVTAAQPPADSITQTDEEETAREAAQIESDIDELRREFSTLSDRHLRLAAEFDNYRKRIERERAELWARAQAELVGRLLDPIDDLERVTAHGDPSAAAFIEGVQLVERKFRQVLEAAGLEEVEAQGAQFDPNAMEAIALVPAESEDEDDVVSDVFQRGYRFKGILVRPARVRVKKHGA